MPRSGWMTDRYERDGMVPIVDEDLLEKIEKNPDAYFENSAHNVRFFLQLWKSICNNNIRLTRHHQNDEIIARYTEQNNALLARIEKLQAMQTEKSE